MAVSKFPHYSNFLSVMQPFFRGMKIYPLGGISCHKHATFYLNTHSFYYKFIFLNLYENIENEPMVSIAQKVTM